MKDVPVPASLVLQDLSLRASAVPPFPRLGVSEVDWPTDKNDERTMDTNQTHGHSRGGRSGSVVGRED